MFTALCVNDVNNVVAARAVKSRRDRPTRIAISPSGKTPRRIASSMFARAARRDALNMSLKAIGLIYHGRPVQ